MPPHSEPQALFLDNADNVVGRWKRNRIGLWLYAGLGVARIILSGLSILVIRR